MSRFKRSGPNEPQKIRISEVEFLGEQDGSPERLLKRRLTEFFQRDQSIDRAYLAITKLDRKRSVALCLKTQFGPDNGLAEKIGVIFALIFNAHEHLDILFLNEQQECRLKRLCSPFFESEDASTVDK